MESDQIVTILEYFSILLILGTVTYALGTRYIDRKTNIIGKPYKKERKH